MADVLPLLAGSLALRRTATIGELFAACSPNFVAALYEAGQEVVGDGDPTKNFFLVVRGLFRAVKFTRDGRRQVFAFYMPGDMCGLEADATHKLTVEAVIKSAMAILPRHTCRVRMSGDPRFNAALFDSATRALTLTVDHMTIFGRNSAEERLAWFLIMLQGRSTLPELCPAVVELAMQRQDIADYLGLSIETISRTFRLFKERGFVNLATTCRVEMLWPAALAQLAAADRDTAPLRPRPRLNSPASLRAVNSTEMGPFQLGDAESVGRQSGVRVTRTQPPALLVEA